MMSCQLFSNKVVNFSVSNDISIQLHAIFFSCVFRNSVDNSSSVPFFSVMVCYPAASADMHVSPFVAMIGCLAFAMFELDVMFLASFFKFFDIFGFTGSIIAISIMVGVDGVELEDGGINLSFLGITDHETVYVLAMTWFLRTPSIGCCQPSRFTHGDDPGDICGTTCELRALTIRTGVDGFKLCGIGIGEKGVNSR